MAYRHATEAEDYADFAAGRVLYAMPGHTAFPVRLTDEIWGRFLALRTRLALPAGPYTLFDPCCGTGYQLTTLALRHGSHIKEIIAGDVHLDAVQMATRNLGLLTAAGRAFRRRELEQLVEQYNKPSHREALTSLQRLEERLPSSLPNATVFQLDVGNVASYPEALTSLTVDLLLCDVPYGSKATWSGQMASDAHDPLHTFLGNLQPFLQATTILALATGKMQKAAHEAYEPLGRFQIGKRRIQFLRLI